MAQRRNKRVFAGFYGRYDGKQIYVVKVVKDIDSGKEVVFCQENLYGKDPSYYVISKESFCEQVVVNGEYVDKYSRKTQFKISDIRISELENDELPTPCRPKMQVDEYSYRLRRNSNTYHEYTKDLCENYLMDLRAYNLCIKEKRYIGMVDKNDFDMLKEDLIFIKECRQTVLREFDGYFKERFHNKKSIRKYAEEYNMNRGSVEYLQKKLFAAFAKALHDRDVADGTIRLKKQKLAK